MARVWLERRLGDLIPGDSFRNGDEVHKITDMGREGALALIFVEGVEDPFRLFPGLVVPALVNDLFDIVEANMIQVGDQVRLLGACIARRENMPPGEVTLVFPGKAISVPYTDSITTAHVVKKRDG